MLDFISNWQLWIIISLLLLIIEIFTPGFVLACFAVACIPPALMTLFGEFALRTQLAVFGLSTILLFFTIRPAVLRFFSDRKNERVSNADALLGMRGIVTQTIPSNSTSGGYVKVDGKIWWAFNPEGVEVKEGASVIVLKVRGASLEVEPAGESDTNSKQGE